jgi:hypothetical protein
MSNLYPGATPEFRFLEKQDSVYILQVRYVNISAGYISKWQDVPVVKEDQQE